MWNKYIYQMLFYKLSNFFVIWRFLETSVVDERRFIPAHSARSRHIFQELLLTSQAKPVTQ